MYSVHREDEDTPAAVYTIKVVSSDPIPEMIKVFRALIAMTVQSQYVEDEKVISMALAYAQQQESKYL